ncbi:chitin deacetylase [Tulasnella sp. 330]|nr:chitin deacetylase [Tulasnella sp. 330]KAG8873499.1 chitin deacetylase [Tulasnella sp. 331]KAG8882287.1 chitin deacetylase [Tulasnella sp. 332]
MKLATSLFALSAASSLVSANGRQSVNERHKAYLERRDRVLGRQAATPAMAVPASTSSSAVAAPVTTPAPAVAAAAATTVVVVSSGSVSAVLASGTSVSGSGTISVSASVPAVTTPTVPGTDIPPLSAIVSDAPIETPLSMFTTFAAGATPPLSGAPPLPTLTTFNPANYPPLDKVPPTDSPEVIQWLSEIDLTNVPNLNQTVDGSCLSDPAFAADTTRCWWTCGGCTRSTDVSSCPTKLDWGVSYDDGPSPYTPKLVSFLHDHNITATFYVVGSRAISRPQMLQTEYMLGHEISDHTWSHPPLTTLSNEQIVAELGWTRKAIKDILGITPRYCRPPYGDIDDRVRGVMTAMGLIPVLWSGSGNDEFDTDDWKIAGGAANGTSSFAAWQNIVSTVATLATGFIVLQHDLYQQSVDLAVGYILPDALAHVPAFSLKSVIECQLLPTTQSYAELAVNVTGPNGSFVDPSGSGSAGTGSKSGAIPGVTMSGAVGFTGILAVGIALVAGW